MRIDLRDGVLIEGAGAELVALAEAVLAAATDGPECVGAFLTPHGVAPVRVVRLDGRVALPGAGPGVSPPGAGPARRAGGP